MVKKVLASGLTLTGITPQTLLAQVENTAPFIFKGDIETSGPKKDFLSRLVFYKKNSKALKNLNLYEYFYLCLSAHWATAGTFVPTDVDNQIREGLWKHGEAQKYIQKMAELVIDSWTWDYSQVTNRKAFNLDKNQVMSTHEGTWLSVAIGAFNALVKNGKNETAASVADCIRKEIKKEEELLLYLQERRDGINFMRAAALMAHNLGDLDRVIDQWKMSEEDPFRLEIYKLGHRPNPHYHPILVFAGEVNKNFLSVENHRHMSMRAPRALRRSHDFLIPVGPFMDEWGRSLGQSTLISLEEKAEIVCAFLEGYRRQDHAFGYIRAYAGMKETLLCDNLFESILSYDVMAELRNSSFSNFSLQSENDFNKSYLDKLLKFHSIQTDVSF